MRINELEMKRLLALIEIEKDKVRQPGTDILCFIDFRSEQVTLYRNSKRVGKYLINLGRHSEAFLQPINFTYPFRGHGEESIYDMRERLAEYDADNWDGQSRYETALDGTYGWNNISDNEVIDTYNEYFGD